MASRHAGFSSCSTQAQYLWCTGLVPPRHVGSSWTRARTCVPCIGRWILNHCTTREVPICEILRTEIGTWLRAQYLLVLLSSPCALLLSLPYTLSLSLFLSLTHTHTHTQTHTHTHTHTHTRWASWRRSSARQPGKQLSSGPKVKLRSPSLTGSFPLRGEWQPLVAFPILPQPPLSHQSHTQVMCCP